MRKTLLPPFTDLDEYRLKNILLDFSDFICYNKTIKRKEVNQK